MQRYAHAYRVGYYEKVAGNHINAKLAGLDATVFVPLVDFKFKNDTPYWLLMETYVNPAASSITWKFYSTSDGRKVAWDTHRTDQHGAMHRTRSTRRIRTCRRARSCRPIILPMART